MNPSGSFAQESPTQSRPNQLSSGPERHHFSIETPFGSAAVVDTVPSEDHEVWVAGFERYPVDHRYYEIVHESLRDQFAHYYLLLKDAAGVTRAVQPFLIVSQDLATGTPAIIRKIPS